MTTKFFTLIKHLMGYAIQDTEHFIPVLTNDLLSDRMYNM